MADLINEGTFCWQDYPRLRGGQYSLTPVDISQNDHDPAELPGMEPTSPNRESLPLSGTEIAASLYAVKKCQRVNLRKNAFFLPDHQKGHLLQVLDKIRP